MFHVVMTILYLHKCLQVGNGRPVTGALFLEYAALLERGIRLSGAAFSFRMPAASLSMKQAP